MALKLCYKEYPYKMSLAAMKQFKQATGQDLWCTLLKFMECYALTKDDVLITRMRKLYETVDFDTAAQLFYSLVKAESKEIPIEEIEDAMFKVGWLPTDRPTDLSEPWPLMLVVIAHEINKEFEQEISEIKK